MRWFKMAFNFNVKGLTPQDAQNTGSSSGGGGSSSPASVTPQNLGGLCLYLDAEINSRKGVRDESVNGMQNLVYTAFKQSKGLGCLEQLNGKATFKDKAITLGGTCYYPNYDLDELTIEVVFQVNDNEATNATSVLLDTAWGGGFQITYYEVDNRVGFAAYDTSGNNAKRAIGFSDFKSQKRYVTVTTKLSEANSTSIYIDGVKLDSSAVTLDGTTGTMSTGYNMGIGGIKNSSTSSVAYNSSSPNGHGVFRCPNIDFSLLRMWSRKLSDSEVVANYNNDKRRFG